VYVLERKNYFEHPDEVSEDAPRAGTMTRWLCNVSPFNRFLVLRERDTWDNVLVVRSKSVHSLLVSSFNLFSSSVPTRERGWYAISGVKRNASVSPDSQKLPLLARRKLVNIGNAVFSRRHFLCQLEPSFEADKKSQSRSVRLSSWIPTDH